MQVLSVIPEAWSLQRITTFLECTFRQLVSDKNESMIQRALTNAENLSVAARLVDGLDSMEPFVQYS